ncbi:uncharacterized protein LOC132701115 [Cylas formicarius]|uniref:uncharacterized protein LOC132701115 n=1 Tax=Cylas formicarius TaxID=197179 RepID=UPI002958ACBE|nr:uncharacterized protein LOC132701115 [Cylas formicarius]
MADLFHFRKLDKARLIEVLRENGYYEVATTLQRLDVDGSNFLDLTEIDLLKWSVTSFKRKLMLDCIKEISRNPNKVLLKNLPATARNQNSATIKFKGRLQELLSSGNQVPPDCVKPHLPPKNHKNVDKEVFPRNKQTLGSCHLPQDDYIEPDDIASKPVQTTEWAVKPRPPLPLPSDKVRRFKPSLPFPDNPRDRNLENQRAETTAATITFLQKYQVGLNKERSLPAPPPNLPVVQPSFKAPFQDSDDIYEADPQIVDDNFEDARLHYDNLSVQNSEPVRVKNERPPIKSRPLPPLPSAKSAGNGLMFERDSCGGKVFRFSSVFSLPKPPAFEKKFTVNDASGLDPDSEFSDSDDGEYTEAASYDVTRHPCYRDIDRNGAKRILQRLEDGAFLFRPSNTYTLGLTVIHNKKCYNVGIQLEENRFICKSSTLNAPKFNTLEELVDYYAEHPLILKNRDNSCSNVYLKMDSFSH